MPRLRKRGEVLDGAEKEMLACRESGGGGGS